MIYPWALPWGFPHEKTPKECIGSLVKLDELLVLNVRSSSRIITLNKTVNYQVPLLTPSHYICT